MQATRRSLIRRGARWLLLAGLAAWSWSSGAQESPVREAPGVAPAQAYGAVGDGKADDTVALQKALDSGRRVALEPGHHYRISRQLVVPSAGGLVGDGSPEIIASAAGFSNTDPTARARYRSQSSVIQAIGQLAPPFAPARDLVFKGFRLRYESTEGRYVDGIVVRNAENLRIEQLTISGFPAGVGIKVASIRGSSVIQDNIIRDARSNTNFLVAYPGSLAQITAIEVDNDLVDGVGSRGLVIARNRISDIVVGPDFIAAQGYQTDGINVASLRAEELRIEDNEIRRTGEAIDMFGVHGTIRGNVITDSYQFGIKLIHGASHNLVTANIVRRSGLAGIVLSGSTSAPQGTEHNTVTGNVVAEIDPDGVWAANDTSCIQLSDNRATVQKARNNRIYGNSLDPGPRGKWVVNRASNSGGNNDVENNQVIARGTRGLITAGDLAPAR